MRAHRRMSVDKIRNIHDIDSEIDIIPFVTMKYLSKKQIESDNLSEFEEKYGFSFRNYELLDNIIKKHKKNEENCISDLKSALNALKNSTRADIKKIYSKIDEEKLTKKVINNLINLLDNDEDIEELFRIINYYQAVGDEKHPKRIKPPFIKLLTYLSAINRNVENVYNPTSLDAQCVTELDEFKHATIYIKDKTEYMHAIQNLLINEIDTSKVSLTNKKVLIDDDDTLYDTIISAPYPNQRITKNDNVEKYSKYQTKNVNSLHLLNLISHLSPDGIIVTTTTQDLLVKKDAYDIRKCLVEKNLIDAIIDYDTGFRRSDTSILVLNNNKKTDDFLFMKCEPGPLGLLILSNDKFILKSYANREIIDKFSNIVTKDEIIKNDYNLNPKRYVYTLDYDKKDIDDILSEQKEYARQIRQINDEINDMLEKIQR